MTFICKNVCSRKDGIGRSSGHEKPDNWRMPFLSHETHGEWKDVKMHWV